MIRVSICPEDNIKNKKPIIVPKTTILKDLMDMCSKKLNMKVKTLYVKVAKGDDTLYLLTDVTNLSDDCTIVCSKKIADSSTTYNKTFQPKSCDVKIISTETHICPDASDQLKHIAKFPHMIRIVGMPDLHPGGSCPIGAVSISNNWLYPHLIGTDIGCGISLVKTDISFKKLTIKKLERCSKSIFIDSHLPETTVHQQLKNDLYWPSTGELKYSVPEVPINIEALLNYHAELGTVGAGNHFIELQTVQKICDAQLCQQYNIDDSCAYLLVHSGSRRVGEAILDRFKNKLKELGQNLENVGLDVKSETGKEYLMLHDLACIWAKRNRATITRRFLEAFGSGENYDCIIDIFHNNLTVVDDDGLCIHRKGVATADKGPVVIPGSRGDYSYVVLPINSSLETGFSIAHGAGRKMSRTKAQELKQKYTSDSLKKTKLDSVVICSNTSLLYEEAPNAYKDIETVVQDLVSANLVKIIAIMKPVLTYKVNN